MTIEQSRDEMSHPVTGIDHCFLLVQDLDRSLEQFQRLGFTVSPRGLHSARKGTANHTIMLSADDYFELLGVVAETEDNAPRRALLARDGEGLHAMACRITDAHDAKARLDALEISTGAVSSFERPLSLPDGSEGVAAFSALSFAGHEVPVGLAFMCQHHTRDMVWRPELMRHENGAIALAGAVAVVGDPERAARRYARLFADGSVASRDGGFVVQTGSIPITFLAPQALASRHPGLDIARTPKNAFAILQIEVDNLDKPRNILERNGIDIHETASSVCVYAEAASGVAIEFIAR